MTRDSNDDMMQHMAESNLAMQTALLEHADQISKLAVTVGRLDERIKGFIEAVETRDDSHSERISSTASQAALTATKVAEMDGNLRLMIAPAVEKAVASANKMADWESKVNLLIWLVSFFGIGGILSLISVVAKGML